jgi:hypothetical protein
VTFHTALATRRCRRSLETDIVFVFDAVSKPWPTELDYMDNDRKSRGCKYRANTYYPSYGRRNNCIMPSHSPGCVGMVKQG